MMIVFVEKPKAFFLRCCGEMWEKIRMTQKMMAMQHMSHIVSHTWKTKSVLPLLLPFLAFFVSCSVGMFGKATKYVHGKSKRKKMERLSGGNEQARDKQRQKKRKKKRRKRRRNAHTKRTSKALFEWGIAIKTYINLFPICFLQQIRRCYMMTTTTTSRRCWSTYRLPRSSWSVGRLPLTGWDWRCFSPLPLLLLLLVRSFIHSLIHAFIWLFSQENSFEVYVCVPPHTRNTFIDFHIS